MRSAAGHWRIAFASLLLVVGIGPALAHVDRSSSAKHPWHIVILNSADPNLPAFVEIDKGTRAALSAPDAHPVEIFSETLDMMRFPDVRLIRELLALFQRKYANLSVDAVIAAGPAAFEFALDYGPSIWPNARIVFHGVPEPVVARRMLAPNVTGIPIRHDVSGAAALALRLRPATRRLIVIGGSSEFDQLLTNIAKAQLEPIARRVSIEYWNDAGIDDLSMRLASLSQNDAVLYLSMYRDVTGRTFVPRDVVTQLVAASPAPIFGLFETFVGAGAVAVSAGRFAARGRHAGEMTLAVLSMGSGSSLTLAAPAPVTCIADFNLLGRFGIDEGLLPPGCDVLFRPPSIWREYRGYVITAVLLLLAQLVLISALLWQRHARRHAEGQVKKQRDELAQGSRLAMAGEMTASIAHEINQPLGAILANTGAAETLVRRGNFDRDELLKILADIRRQDMRASEVIRRVRALVTARVVAREAVDVNELVDDVMALLGTEAESHAVRVEKSLARDLPVLHLDRVQIQQAIVNLCLNALAAMADTPAERRRLTVSTRRGDNGGVEIAVQDSGTGIAPEHLPRLFDSFFTTKARGMGLGLSIARSTIEAHGGRLAAENAAEGGAVFRIILPAPATQQEEATIPAFRHKLSGAP